MRKIILCLILSCCLLPVHGEERDSTGLRTSSMMLGIGGTNQQDTYLSPLSYTGPEVSFLHESLRMTRWAQHRVSFQGIFQTSFTYTHEKPNKSHYLGAHLGYDAAWHYNWTPLPRLRLMAGGAVGADVGFLYSDRNGNNPAQAKANIDLSASVIAIYTFCIRKLPLTVRYQANLPLVGAMFSPNYGQSYYEIGQGNWDHNICCTYPGNAFSLWQMITFDIPLSKKVTLRAGYLCDIRQSSVNNLIYHDRSHSFLIGFVKHFRLL